MPSRCNSKKALGVLQCAKCWNDGHRIGNRSRNFWPKQEAWPLKHRISKFKHEGHCGLKMGVYRNETGCYQVIFWGPHSNTGNSRTPPQIWPSFLWQDCWTSSWSLRLAALFAGKTISVKRVKGFCFDILENQPLNAKDGGPFEYSHLGWPLKYRLQLKLSRKEKISEFPRCDQSRQTMLLWGL